MISEGIFSLLSTDAGVSALVGTRVYPVRLPTNPTYPCVRYLIVGGSSDPTFKTSGLQRIRLQVDGFGATHKSADAVRDAVTALLDGYVGTLSDGTYVQNITQIQPLDYDDPDALAFRCMVEFYVLFDVS